MRTGNTHLPYPPCARCCQLGETVPARADQTTHETLFLNSLVVLSLVEADRSFPHLPQIPFGPCLPHTPTPLYKQHNTKPKPSKNKTQKTKKQKNKKKPKKKTQKKKNITLAG